jgi:hypothetical protein
MADRAAITTVPVCCEWMSTHILVPCTAINVRLLLTIFKEGTENSSQLQPLNYLAGRGGKTFTLVIVQGFKNSARLSCILVQYLRSQKEMGPLILAALI